MRRSFIVGALTLTMVGGAHFSCGRGGHEESEPAPLDASKADVGPVMDGGVADAFTPLPCLRAGEPPLEIGYATKAGDFALELVATSSATRWSVKGNEANVLDVSVGAGPTTQILLHQGETQFSYGTIATATSVGEPIRVRISEHSSATDLEKKVCFSDVKITPSDAHPLREGVEHAPILKWPVPKRFDDVPLLLGWSRSKKEYVGVMTHENGGTVRQCGGGAKGIAEELKRWGRACDVETILDYGPSPTWRRCTGTVSVSTNPLRMEGQHSIVYYGNGHNNFFESRAGYGVACGSGAPEKADGDLVGWGETEKGSSDELVAITLRPVPVDLDALDYPKWSGRREGLLDTYAPWLYRVTFSELSREGAIDNALSFPMQQYLYVDVHVSDVGGSGSDDCGLPSASQGFKVRVVTGAGTIASSGQMTASFTGNGEVWKRVAIAIPSVVPSKGVTGLIFDAYDGDGIYFLELGDVFFARSDAGNGAILDYVQKGKKTVNVYVDDDMSGCVGGKSTGPGGVPMPCVGTSYTVAMP